MNTIKIFFRNCDAFAPQWPKTHFMYISHYLLAMLRNVSYSTGCDFDIIYSVYFFLIIELCC